MTDQLVADLGLAHRLFRDQLIEAGHLVPSGIDGLYGRGAEYEAVFEGVDRVVWRLGIDTHGAGNVTRLRFPPVFPREAYEKTDYIASFPQLTGAISTFTGDSKQHRSLLLDREAGLPWDGHLCSAGTMLVSAACHPLYATLPSTLPTGGSRYNVHGYCFRHEPSDDPLRMQAFRMQEFVYVGDPAGAIEHRATWTRVAHTMFTELELSADAVPANDPFFGRTGKLLATNQLEEGLKTEFVVRLYGDLDEGTALTSCNNHQDHFGAGFDISTSDGEVAHSACVGIGMDRITLALFAIHGIDSGSWPSHVRTALAL
ncbi:amino acid--[acyl-carrier-protein] ligase [Gordonia otitidis]|uniref:amino acid--[acyl-carrier-protein] ligase n=1 Tax=Gordonia otitidis TaxID=249058 RepID=UPI001D14E187|nr:amino acid--[acyl-carrier-protein] ligase [Gordonia otitidis]UEA57800.1 amino acid--[acyl-carrier-protein] ligase [Gordonia otitidis]